MKKQIFSIGYEIPAHSDDCYSFNDTPSLMDADIILISPDSIEPSGDWVSFTSSDGGCYNVEASKKYEQKISHFKKELIDHLNAGKNIFLFLTEEVKETLSNGVSSKRKGESTYNTYYLSNYVFLPTNIGQLTTASGKHVEFTGNSIFSDFFSIFEVYFKYELYVENPRDAQIVFTGKDKSKILGAIYKVGSGNLITLPVLSYDRDDFIETRIDKNGEDKHFWNKEGIAFGKRFVKCLIDIDRSITRKEEKTPTPDWASSNIFLGNKEKILLDSINTINSKVEELIQERDKLNIEVDEERELKGLLFEQGKPLENAVIKALRILGFKAENYNDGNLEMDQVIISPEKNRYVGETEGKDNKDVDITKFRQLVDALNADFAREEVKEKAFGILFGNAERLKDPKQRKLDFTDKCKLGAEREKIALVKTADLFVVAKYLNENNDDDFRKECRKAIHNGLGGLVRFPQIPNINGDGQA